MKNVLNWLCQCVRFARVAIGGLGLCVTLVAQADIIRVDPTSPINGDGDDPTWSNAKHTIPAAIGVSSAGDEIHVAGGTPTTPEEYTPLFPSTGVVSLKSVVSIHGGYAGWGAGNPDDRDPAYYRTVLKGNAWIVVGIQGNALSPSQLLADPWDRANLVGFEITGGVGAFSGGGINGHGDATHNVLIRNCKIYGNYASGDGGGFYGYNVIFRDCEFKNNHADGRGGAMYVYGKATILNCDVHDNSSDSDGGGIAIVGHPVTIVSSKVTANQCDGEGCRAFKQFVRDSGDNQLRHRGQ